jgi:hypothetical protein
MGVEKAENMTETKGMNNKKKEKKERKKEIKKKKKTQELH